MSGEVERGKKNRNEMKTAENVTSGTPHHASLDVCMCVRVCVFAEK